MPLLILRNVKLSLLFNREIKRDQIRLYGNVAISTINSLAKREPAIYRMAKSHRM
jgi:hypothetical protein